METTDIFIVSITLFLLEHHKFGIIQYVDFPDWFHSSSDIHWRSLHGLSWHDTSILLNTQCTTTYFVYLPSEGHLNCFQSLEIMNKAAINIHVQIYVGPYIFNPGGTNGRQPNCQCRRPKRCWFNAWVRKIPLEEGMATCSSILAWRIPWTEKPVGLRSIGLQRVRHDWGDLAWARKFSALLAKYQGVWLLDFMVRVYLIF